ncbi:MAG: hypothetical protein ACOWWH_01520 [Eubacteriaceae bacterium]
MNPERWLTICTYGICISVIFGAIFGLGYRHFGNIVSESKNAYRNKELEEMLVKEIRNAFIEGSAELVEKIPKNQEWNFEQGTFEYILKENILFKNKPLKLIVTSKDKSKILKIYKDENDFIRFIYQSPEIGTITRGAQIKRSDFVSSTGKSGVYIAYTWNLKEQKTTLYINAKERDDIYNSQ